jgi:hypothetical protein
MAKKRAHGEGTIVYNEQRNNWQAKMMLPNGKRKSIYGKTQREAREKLASLKREIDAGMHGTLEGEQSLGVFCERWLTHHVKDRRSKTWVGYETDSSGYSGLIYGEAARAVAYDGATYP